MICCSSPKIYSRNGFFLFLGRMQAALNPFLPLSGSFKGIFFFFFFFLAFPFWYFIVQFSHSVMSDSLRPHGLQHAWLPCPSPTPGAYSNSCPSNWWYHPTISSSVIPFSSCLQYFPALGSFPVSQFFTSGGQSIGVSASALSFQWIFRANSFRVDWFDLLAVQGTLQSLL